MALVQFAQDYTQQISNIVKAKQTGIGGIYLGNINAVKNIQLLTSKRICAVISIISELEVKLPQKINNLKIRIDDSPFEKISQYFQASNVFIDKNLKKGNVLVHCYAGISRSATLVIAYLMFAKKYFLKHAIHKVRKNRNFIQPNKGFLIQLQEYEKFLLQKKGFKLK